jgi:ABC-type sugar transport system permease subunit
MALNKQEFTRNQRVKEITFLSDARFPVTVSQFVGRFGLFAAYYLYSDGTQSNTTVGGARWSDMEAR